MTAVALYSPRMPTRRTFLFMVVCAVPGRLAAQRQRLTKDQLQQQLKTAILEPVRASKIDVASSGDTIVNNWVRKGADRLVDEQSEGNLGSALANAQRCGEAIVQTAGATPDRKATGALILGVFQKLCPIYPFC